MRQRVERDNHQGLRACVLKRMRRSRRKSEAPRFAFRYVVRLDASVRFETNAARAAHRSHFPPDFMKVITPDLAGRREHDVDVALCAELVRVQRFIHVTAVVRRSAKALDRHIRVRCLHASMLAEGGARGRVVVTRGADSCWRSLATLDSLAFEAPVARCKDSRTSHRNEQSQQARAPVRAKPVGVSRADDRSAIAAFASKQMNSVRGDANEESTLTLLLIRLAVFHLKNNVEVIAYGSCRERLR